MTDPAPRGLPGVIRMLAAGIGLCVLAVVLIAYLTARRLLPSRFLLRHA